MMMTVAHRAIKYPVKKVKMRWHTVLPTTSMGPNVPPASVYSFELKSSYGSKPCLIRNTKVIRGQITNNNTKMTVQ